MKTIPLALIALSLSFSISSVFAQSLERHVRELDSVTQETLKLSYLDFLREEFIAGSDCAPIGSEFSEDLNRVEFCLEILHTEFNNVSNDTWARAFNVSANQNIASIDGITYFNFLKRFEPIKGTGDSLCDVSILFPTEGLSQDRKLIFEVYCD